MQILAAIHDGHNYVVHGTNFKISSRRNGWRDSTVKADKIIIYEDGKMITDFGENFSGMAFDAEDAMASLVLGYVNNDTTIDVKKVAPALAAFRDKFVCDNKVSLEEGRAKRVIPKKYLTTSGKLDLELVTNDGAAFYTDGDNFIVTYPDGSMATDMEPFYYNAFSEAIEEGNFQWVSEDVNIEDYIDETEENNTEDTSSSKSQKVHENNLMESAMRIMDLYCEMSMSHHLNPDKLDRIDYMDLLQLFCDWAREYEDTFALTPEYTDNWQEHTEKIFTEKLKKEFGGKC